MVQAKNDVAQGVALTAVPHQPLRHNGSQILLVMFQISLHRSLPVNLLEFGAPGAGRPIQCAGDCLLQRIMQLFLQRCHHLRHNPARTLFCLPRHYPPQREDLGDQLHIRFNLRQ